MKNDGMDRRSWLKTAVATGSALTLGAGWPLASAAHPIRAIGSAARLRFTEAGIAREFPKLKARLFANENPFGPSDKAKEAITAAIANSYQYPFIAFEALLSRIADKEKLKPEQIAIAPGSSSLLHAAALHFSKEAGEIISGDPSYDDLPEKSEVVGGVQVKIPLKNDYTLDLGAMEKAIGPDTRLVYICNPNNPTGTKLDASELKAFCVRVSARVPVLVDEAYIDYLSDPDAASMMSLVREGHQVMVFRTFSKLHGFAGLRVGYMTASEEMIKHISRYVWPEAGLAATSIAAALASYEDRSFLADAARKTAASKEYLCGVLKTEGYTYIPSSTNFVMFPVKMDAERFVEEMMKRGVGVRPWKFANKQWCRVSIGKMEEMEAFATAFREIS